MNRLLPVLLVAINTYRASQNLPAVNASKETCDFAQVRANEITAEFNHAGFRKRIDAKSLPYNGYAQVTENIARTSDYKNVVSLWINSPGHAENMRKDTPYVCVSYNGNFYAYEGMKK